MLGVPPSRKTGKPEKAPSALFLTEVLSELNQGANFLDRLKLEEIQAVRREATVITLGVHENVFMQGDPHKGIYLIEEGKVRTYYAGPSGKEMTLAHWTPGHFVGGPEIFGGGIHIWSAVTLEPARLAFLSGGAIRRMVQGIPAFAVCMIEGLAAKGKCYSALVQMLGTRSVVERIAQLILVLAQVQGHREGENIVIDREITQEQIANIVGSTRQWVTIAFQRLEKQGILTLERNKIIIHRLSDLTSAIC